MAELQSGQSLAGRFTLIRHLGSGGMGEVWLARDQDLGVEVVTKLVAADATPEQIALLQQECRSARRLSHPNIVRVFDFHQNPGATFITMEYIDGGTVAELRGRDPQEIIRQLLPLAEALEYAHGEGVIHRDIKSGNVLLDGSGRPRLSDFGIAGALEPDTEDLLVAGGGSRDHASPQQLAGEAPSPADDIFGFGALLVDLLSASSPIPDGLRSVVQSMMASAPGDRPPSMSEVRRVLEEIVAQEAVDGTVPPTVVKQEVRLSPPPRVARVRSSEPMPVPQARSTDDERSRRHPYWWATIAIFVVLATVALGVFVWLPDWVEQRPPRPDVEEGIEEVAPVGTETSRVAASDPALSDREEAEAHLPDPLDGPADSLAEIDEPAVIPVTQPEPQVRKQPTPPPAPARVDPRVEQFAGAMTLGLQSLEREDFVAAKGAFQQALSLSPGSVEAADGLARSEQALRLAEIRGHQARAEALEQEERWHDAQREYSAALALDPTLRFAKEGGARSAARAKLDDDLAFHIAHPERLSEETVLEEAQGSLSAARALEPTTEKLGSQIRQLQNAIKLATTPIRVMLVSDNETQVVVYRVGRLGAFESRALDLRPGIYTVVGTREGYRDVRRQLQVVAGGDNKPLSIRCEDQI